MAIYGRILRQKARDDAAETPERAAERIRCHKACTLAVAEREAKFPLLTAATAAEAINYQEQRTAYWMEKLK